MEVRYGPPGHKGVTQLMAVDGDELVGSEADRVLTRGGWTAVAVWGLGVVTGSRTIKQMGLGGAVAMFLARAAHRRQRTVVAETAPAPTPTGIFYLR